jgi:hypothetical protein
MLMTHLQLCDISATIAESLHISIKEAAEAGIKAVMTTIGWNGIVMSAARCGLQINTMLMG